jgi:hypothetical protein
MKNEKKKKNPSRKRASGVAQGIGPEFKHQNHNKKKKERKSNQWLACSSRAEHLPSSWFYSLATHTQKVKTSS